MNLFEMKREYLIKPREWNKQLEEMKMKKKLVKKIIPKIKIKKEKIKTKETLVIVKHEEKQQKEPELLRENVENENQFLTDYQAVKQSEIPERNIKL
jgi:hypothetical protein